MIIMMGQRAAASAERIYEILDEQPTIVDRPGAVDLVDCKGDVRFDERRVLLRPRRCAMVLADFDLHLRPGETVALVGRTGSGKSTVARLLTRFYDVTEGTVRPIDGHDVRDLTLDSLRANVGVVLDEPFLFSVSIRDNIAYGRPDADIAEVEAAARAAGADEFIRELPDGYDTVVGERGYTLSGGQRQRIAIARTLLVNPPILVLDDATSAIDVQVEQQIHDGLRGPDGGAHHPDHRPPAVDHQPGRSGGPARRRHGSWPTAPTPSCSRPPRSTPRSWPRSIPRPSGSCSRTARRGHGPDGRTRGTADGLRRRMGRRRPGMFGGRRAARRARPRPGCPSPASPPSSRTGSTRSWPRSPTTASPTSSSPSNRAPKERRRLSLWGLLLEYPRHAGAWPRMLVVVTSVALQAAPSSPSSPSTTAWCPVIAI